MKKVIWTIFTILLITNIVSAKFVPAEKIRFDTYQVTDNRFVDYSICTSKNVREAGANVELKETYQARNIYLEDRVFDLEHKPHYEISAFLMGVILGLLL